MLDCFGSLLEKQLFKHVPHIGMDYFSILRGGKKVLFASSAVLFPHWWKNARETWLIHCAAPINRSMQISPWLEQPLGSCPFLICRQLNFFVNHVVLRMVHHSPEEQCQGTQAGLFQSQHFSGPCPILCSPPSYQHCRTLH